MWKNAVSYKSCKSEPCLIRVGFGFIIFGVIILVILPPVKILKINAYVAPGNSGGVVLNSDMEIVGIVIGGGTDLLGRFKCGYMVPCDLILEFLNDCKTIR